MAFSSQRLAVQSQILLPCFILLFCLRCAEAYQCSNIKDHDIGDAESSFQIVDWIYRGLCVRRVEGAEQCYQVLENVLDNLNSLRASEYQGAAGVLALLPTIGALMGAPAPEIWRLLTLYPLGGILSIFLSFGGAIMPVDVEDYEQVMTKKEPTIGSVISFRRETIDPHEGVDGRLDTLLGRIRNRILRAKGDDPPGRMLPFGLLWMCLLLFMAQFGMAVVEQGSIIPWWCGSTWWMHMWYFLVTLTAIIENYAQLPFIRQYRFFVSSIPYQVEVVGGEKILHNVTRGKVDDNVKEEMRFMMRQMQTLRTAKVFNHGSSGFTAARCSVTVLVSVIGKTPKTSFLRLFSKAASITVFVCGTAIFAAVTLLSLEAAVMILTLLLCGGIFGRALAGGMVSVMSNDEPLIHAIVPAEHECEVVSAILREKAFHPDQDFQIEINGNIFVGQQRITRRRWGPWYVRFWGVKSKPFNLVQVVEKPVINRYGIPADLSPPPQIAMTSLSPVGSSPARYSRSPNSRLINWEEENHKRPPSDYRIDDD